MKKQCKQGFTLIEVLFASLLVAIAILSFVSAQSGSIKLTTKADEVTTAIFLAQAKLTEYEHLLLKEGFTALEGKKKSGRFEEKDFQDFAWEIEVKDSGIDLLLNLAGNAEQDNDSEQQNPNQILEMANKFINDSLQMVSCRVYWGERNHIREVLLQTYVAKLDVPLNPQGSKP